jgi:acid-sensing ion channel, other
MKLFRLFVEIFEDYCLNSSLAGMRYLVERKYHVSERIFWLICVIMSWVGSTKLILLFIDDYINNSVSMGVISLGPTESVNFPSIGVCEIGDMKKVNPKTEAYVREVLYPPDAKDYDYNYEVEDFLMRSSFVNLYTRNKFISLCEFDECDEDEICIGCPDKGYEDIIKVVRANCTNLFNECRWRGKVFDCCKYFRPVPTSQGLCYLINSLQATEKNSQNWLNMKIGLSQGSGRLFISVTKSTHLYILSHEDVPHLHLTAYRLEMPHSNFIGEMIIQYKDIINAENVRNIDPEIRKCKFPDERGKFTYKAYSFTTCATECLKNAQIKFCGCSHAILHHGKIDEAKICDFKGLLCLDEQNLIVPKSFVMQPWHPSSINCSCLPSCDEPQITIVSRSSSSTEAEESSESELRNVTVKILQNPSQRYYRQAVKEKIDIFGKILNIKQLANHSRFSIAVSVGGILGLFMGASILSFIEIVYFFTLGSIKKWKEFFSQRH